MSTVSQVSRCCQVFWSKLALDSRRELREDGRLSGHYFIFGVTSGLPVNRPELLNLPPRCSIPFGNGG